jgi:hypothetical protein
MYTLVLFFPDQGEKYLRCGDRTGCFRVALAALEHEGAAAAPFREPKKGAPVTSFETQFLSIIIREILLLERGNCLLSFFLKP